MAHANRTVLPPRGLEGHSRRRLVALYSDRVEYIDRCAIARMSDPVAAIIGADQPDAGSERNIMGSKAPGLIAEADAFPFRASGAGEQNTSWRGFVAPVGRERPSEREPEPPAVPHVSRPRVIRTDDAGLIFWESQAPPGELGRAVSKNLRMSSV